MQASDRVLAGRYAAALFQAAAAKGEEQKVQADLGSAHNLLLDAMSVLRHPRVPPASKKKLLHDALGGKVSAMTLRFLDLLVDKKRFDLMVMVSAVYAKLAAEKRGLAKAHVRTAAPLSSEAQQQLAAKLKKFTGKEIELDVKEDSELIGGVTVKIGDWVLDSSLRGQLRRLRESFN
ncbi:MAG: F0F1 ATP synthase subunit delta [Elusimicrobia bacterium CG11_big_fil_rev_8_21_14_0_20_64_6]|nr:MAG: F0F1 ATP synthase subunit delta [Elusimicrobia bacterium CG11_big_fil_rev_8_21_14_0_20_64_6]